MRVSEIFYSISGEGIHAGTPTVFVRLAGCNLRCDYCDTKYAWDGGEEMSPPQVKERAYGLSKTYPRINIVGGWVLITGGEPMLQAEAVFGLVGHLKAFVRKVEIETNGSYDPPEWFGVVDCWSVDVKCPSSGSSYGSFKPKWLRKLRKQDQLKFVVGTKEDLDFVRGFLNGIRLRPTALVSPVVLGELSYSKLNQPWLQEVAEFCKEQNVRMSLQLHKVVWGDKKGV